MSDIDVTTFMALTNCAGEEKSKSWLKYFSGNLQLAVNKFWDLGGCFPEIPMKEVSLPGGFNADDAGSPCRPPENIQPKYPLNKKVLASKMDAKVDCAVRERRMKLEVDQLGGYIKILNIGNTVIDLNNWSITQSSGDTNETFGIMAEGYFKPKGVKSILDPGETLTMWSLDKNNGPLSPFDYVMPKKRWGAGDRTTTLCDAMHSVIYGIATVKSNPLSAEPRKENDEPQKAEIGKPLVYDLEADEKEGKVPSSPSRKRPHSPKVNADLDSSGKRDKR